MTGPDSPAAPARVLVLSTTAFTLLFAVWLMLGVLGVPIRDELHLSPAEFDWLLAVAILAGSLPRLHFGLWADRYGGRLVTTLLLLGCAVPTALVAWADSYPRLVACAALFGLAGNSFTAGVSWVSAWSPQATKGTALGVFGAGNVGAAATKFLGPAVLAGVPAAGLLGGFLPGGWRLVPVVYAGLLVAMAAAVWRLAPAPDRCPGRGRTTRELLAPLRHPRVWRFGLYYVVVFGAYVALAAYLPRYYVDVHGLSLATAGYLTALFIFPASLLRPLGGWLADRHGPRAVMYAVFGSMALALAAASLPASVLDVGPGGFTALMLVVGCGMGVGKAAVFKYVPDYFPRDVGAVGGLVGLLGAIGGFLLPPAFGLLGRATGSPQAAFLALLALTLVSLGWLHAVVRRLTATRPAPAPAPVAG